jgi:transposase-like protein
MGKEHVNISVDGYILDEAKKKGINISKEAERAIVKKINPENSIDKEGSKCEYCGKEMRQATANDMNGLYFFLPDEKWICPTCEYEFTKKIINDANIVDKNSEEHKREIKQEIIEVINLMKKEILEQLKNEPYHR